MSNYFDIRPHTAAHRRFNRIRHVAPMCTPSNTCFLESTSVHVPNGNSIISTVLHSSQKRMEVAILLSFSRLWYSRICAEKGR